MEVAVYCASSTRIGEPFRSAARRVGEGLAALGHGLVYGGGNVGLMREVAVGVHDAGGHVAGYIPAALMAIEGRAYAIADELVVTDTMQIRKHSIFSRADAFLTLAGGVGTLEEFMEVVTLRKLGYHNKPIVLLNTAGFYDQLLGFLQYTVQQGLTPSLNQLFEVASTSTEALNLIERQLEALSPH
jgi:cytokinin riboside 5'-monophosphate phosphoribohydrolase